MQQLGGLDSMMVLGEIANVPLHMSALFIYDPSTSDSGAIQHEQVTVLLSKLIDSSLPSLKCRTEKVAFNLDKPYWVNDKDFNLDYHIQRFALPKPADWAQLHELIGHFHAQPLNPDRPLWQCLYIEGLDNLEGLPKGCVAIIMKIHHALADGKTALKIFSELHTLSSESGAPLIADGMDDDIPDFSAPSVIDKYSRAYWHLISSPVKLALNLGDIGRRVMFSGPKSSAPALPIPDTVFNQLPSADRKVGHIRMPMDEIKAIEKKSGTTINDIAMCIIAGGLREFLRDRKELPAESLVAGMPISIRAEDDKSQIGNQVSLANVSLFTDIKNPKARLQAIHAAATGSKRRNRQMGPASMLSVVDNLQPGLAVWAGARLIEAGLVDKLPRMNNAIISNVPGIQVPCYLAGAKLVDYVGFGPLAPTVSLFHVISSIYSHLCISYQSCRKSLEDPEHYTRSLEHSYQALKKAYQIPAKAKKTSRRKKQ